MSALGWELPLDAICVNGSFAQKVHFAKSRELLKPDLRHPINMPQISVCSPHD
jgi:hypothetical protein